jgi:type I restriction enzyme M protein
MDKQLLGFQEITKKVAKNIHEYLYSSIKLGDQEKATLIAGILIALENDSFKNTYQGMVDEDQFIDAFMSAIKYSIIKFDGLKNGKESVISVFDFIKHNDSFKKVVENGNKKYIALQFLTEIVDKSIYTIAKSHPSYDILGEFYNEFTKYSGADQQSLGIVLTPHHIASFMAELLEINDDDIILDTCAGSASLLLTAEHSNVKQNKIVGVEYSARMLSLAVANAMIKDIPSYLLLGDSFNESVLQEIKTQKPTKLILNPPYAQKGYPELGFLIRGLDVLEKNGKGIIILPISSTIKLDNQMKSFRKELLEKHTLEAVFSMPERLFYPINTHTVIMFFTAHVPHNKETFLGDLRKDGFETVKNQGRQDTKNLWTGIKNDMISSFKNKEEYNFGLFKNLSIKDEWHFIAHKKITFKISKEDFIKKLRAYDKFQNPEKYWMEE